MGKNRRLKFLILGAGVAGLGASVTLQRKGKKSLILEKESLVGGLNRSITISGCDFDYGPKILLLDNSENSKEILFFLKGNYERYSVVERTYLSKFGLLGFPLQRYLFDLPKYEIEKIFACLEMKENHPKEVKSFKDWLIKNYGEYFCQTVLFPYEEKKWRIPLEQMDYQWTLDRPIKVPQEEVLEGSKRKLPPNQYYYYPRVGNISALTLGMNREAGEVVLDCEVTGINLSQRYVNTNKGKFFYSYLISSLPLNYLCSITTDLPKKFKDESKKSFKYLGVFVFNLVFKDRHKLDGTAIYYPEKKFCFRRVVVLQNLCPALGRHDYTPISVELSIEDDGKIDERKILKRILLDFSQIESLKHLGKLVAWNVLRIGFAYPFQLNGLREKVKKVQDYYEKFDVYQCGRGGNLDYCNSDQAYKQGKELALKILKISQ